MDNDILILFAFIFQELGRNVTRINRSSGNLLAVAMDIKTNVEGRAGKGPAFYAYKGFETPEGLGRRSRIQPWFKLTGMTRVSFNWMVLNY